MDVHPGCSPQVGIVDTSKTIPEFYSFRSIIENQPRQITPKNDFDSCYEFCEAIFVLPGQVSINRLAIHDDMPTGIARHQCLPVAAARNAPSGGAIRFRSKALRGTG
ncbi:MULTISPECIES: hypothetical protein [Paraburkholderia]|uniref:hypothetical protein n=1 Tax=Paraburkholderia TaxID=1822464 RepID=UPI003B79E515